MGLGFFFYMSDILQNMPQPLRGYMMVNVLDSAGRIVIPNAIFQFHQSLKLVGVGHLPSGDEGNSKFQLIHTDVQSGTQIKMGMFNGAMYLMATFKPEFKTRGRFVTLVRELDFDGEKIIQPYKTFSIDKKYGVEEAHTLSVPDADEVVLITPYASVIRSDSRLPKLYFLLRKGPRLARIPMPNSWADGAFCIGKGVEFETLPSPFDLVMRVYDCLMEDTYNADLWDQRHSQNEWVLTPNGFHCTVPFKRCISVVNEPLLNILL
jgi:hypothetical protein